MKILDNTHKNYLFFSVEIGRDVFDNISYSKKRVYSNKSIRELNTLFNNTLKEGIIEYIKMKWNKTPLIFRKDLEIYINKVNKTL